MLALVFFQIKGWDQDVEACGGAAEVRCLSKERKRKTWEREEWISFPLGVSKLLGQLGQGKSTDFSEGLRESFFSVNANKYYGATQANKPKIRSGFVECFQSLHLQILPVWRKFSAMCGGLGWRTFVNLVSNPHTEMWIWAMVFYLSFKSNF